VAKITLIYIKYRGQAGLFYSVKNPNMLAIQKKIKDIKNKHENIIENCSF